MELFTFLDPLREAGFVADFVPRIPGEQGSYQKEEALADLEPYHRKVVARNGFDWSQLWRAEQVHGVEIAEVVGSAQAGEMMAGVDGLMTTAPQAMLGIYAADCGLIWIADRENGAIALLHSGRKGTEGGILTNAIVTLEKTYRSRPENLIVVLGPCIRPPHYEVDIAAQIAEQAEAAGVGEFHDCGICTAANLEQFYSYRREKGLTGRMIGLLASPTRSN